MTRIYSGVLALAAVAAVHVEGAKRMPAKSAEYLIYVGTYTKGQSKGIYAYRFHEADGTATPLGLAAEASNPSFLTVHPNGRFLYAVNETAQGEVSAFAIDPASGKLQLLNRVSTRGADPCHLSLDRTNHYLLAANYSSGSVAVFPVLNDGRLGEMSSFIQHHGSGANKERQEGPHAHWVETSPDNRFALVSDLGLDQVLVYRFDATKGTLMANDPPYAQVKSGSGPRHIAFSHDGRRVYVISEIASTVTAFDYDSRHGALRELQAISTLPTDFHGESNTAEIAISGSGKFLYGSNRGHDSVAVFSIHATDGKLTPVEYVPTGGKTPRHFGMDPAGEFLLAENQDSDDIVVFRVDSKTGRLTATGQKMEVGSPVCAVFVPVK